MPRAPQSHNAFWATFQAPHPAPQPRQADPGPQPLSCVLTMPHPHRPHRLLRRYSRPAVGHHMPRWRSPQVNLHTGAVNPYRDWPPARRRGRANSHPAVVMPVVIGVMATVAGVFFPIGIFAFVFGFIAWRSRRVRRQRARRQVAQAARGVKSNQKFRNSTHRTDEQGNTVEVASGVDPTSLQGLRDTLKEQDNARGVAEAQRLMELKDRLSLDVDAGGVNVPDELKTPIKSLLEAGKGMLRKAVKLGAVSPQLSTPEAREEMGALMDELLIDLAETNGELAHALDQLQLRDVRNDRPEREIDRLRRELDEQLNVARRVDQRLDILDDEIQPDAPERMADGW